MRAAVEDVHHRHRQQVGVGPADVAVERQPGRLGRGLGDGERGAEDRVGAEVGLVGRAVELVHRLVDLALVVGTEALDGRADLLDHRVDGLLHALAEVAVAAVAQLDRLELPRGRAARARPRGRTRRRRAAPRPRRWGCRASRGSRGRRQLRWMPRVLPGPVDRMVDLTVALTLLLPHAGATGVQPVDRLRPAVRTMAGMEEPDHAVRRPVRQSLRRLRPERRAVLRGDRPRSRRPAAGAAGRDGARHRLGSRRGHPPARRRRRPDRSRRRRRPRPRHGAAAWREDTAHLAHVHVTQSNAADPRPPAPPYDVIASSMVIFFLDDPVGCADPVARPAPYRAGASASRPSSRGTARGRSSSTSTTSSAEDPLPTDDSVRDRRRGRADADGRPGSPTCAPSSATYVIPFADVEEWRRWSLATPMGGLWRRTPEAAHPEIMRRATAYPRGEPRARRPDGARGRRPLHLRRRLTRRAGDHPSRREPQAQHRHRQPEDGRVDAARSWRRRARRGAASTAASGSCRRGR